MDKEKKKEGKMDMASMMETYKKLATPGPVHKLLEKLTGSWVTRTKARMDPNKPPVESTGTCVQKMILGGRYLQQEYTGDMMGQKFNGINLIGYDNQTGKAVSIWIDDMSTGITYFEGTASADGKTLTQECSLDDPVRGHLRWRSVTRFLDDNTLGYEMYITPEGGKEVKEMEMTVTRKEAAKAAPSKAA